MSVRSMKPCRERWSSGVDGLVPGVGGEVVDLPAHVQHGVPQRVVLGGAVGVGDDHGALRLGAGDVLDDRQHRGDAGPRAGQQQRPVGWLDDEVPGRGADIQQVIAGLDVVVQVATTPGRPARRSPPRTRRTVICSRVPSAVEDTVYCRG